MAVFGVPVAADSPEALGADAERAVACRLALGKALKELNQSWSVRNFPEVKMRVGIFYRPDRGWQFRGQRPFRIWSNW